MTSKKHIPFKLIKEDRIIQPQIKRVSMEEFFGDLLEDKPKGFSISNIPTVVYTGRKYKMEIIIGEKGAKDKV